jgi:hypothetical protein
MAPQVTEPNQFTLRLGGTTIIYSTSSFAGPPQLSLDEDGNSRNWSGDEIEREETSLGALVTVTLELVADLKRDTLSLLLPEIHLPKDGSSDFTAIVIWTTHRTSIAGPGAVEGPIQVYTCVKTFHGTAKQVDF